MRHHNNPKPGPSRLLTVIFGCIGLLMAPIAAPANPVVNEFMADNSTTTTDPQGQFEDWIEIHNPSGAPVDLAGMYLTDTLADPTQHQIAIGTNVTIIPAGGFLVFWADNDEVDGPLHLNFRLGVGGESIGLFDTDGSTLLDSFTFGAQLTDVSMGRFPDGADDWRSMGVPTPGTANNSGQAGEVTLSPTCATFTASINVTLGTAYPGGTVRYTLDGSDPTAGSAAYAAPINITASTELKARVYAPAVSPGPRAIGSYIKLAPTSNFGGLAPPTTFNSDLPIVIIENFNDGAINGSAFKPFQLKIFEPDETTARTTLTNQPSRFIRAGLKVRGASSSGFPKKQYRMEIWDAEGGQRNVPLLGLPAESDWVLAAPYVDESLIRNAMIFSIGRDMGLEASRTRFCEVFLNTDGGDLESGDYVGVYALTESVKRDNNRIDIARLTDADTAEPEVTGGYIIRHEAGASSGPRLNGWNHLETVEPDPPNAAQMDWISDYVNSFSTNLHGSAFKDPVIGYARYIDVGTFVDTMVINEFTREQDSYVRSAYLHKDREGPLVNGPLWDYNLSFGISCCFNSHATEGWQHPHSYNSGDRENYPYDDWYNRLMEDEQFEIQWIDRWCDVRSGILHLSNFYARVDAYAAQVTEAQARNFTRWTTLGSRTTGFQRNEYIYPTWEEHIQHIKDWAALRLSWIDSQFLDHPIFDVEGGLIAPGTPLTMTGPATIYYTVNGPDPRAFGGTVAPAAQTYAAGFLLNSNVIVRARAWDGVRWSCINQAVFTTLLPGLTVAELMYDARPGTNPIYSSSDYDFIEIANTSAVPQSLIGVSLAEGIAFDFFANGISCIAPGEHLVVVQNLAAFTNRYPGVPPSRIAGVYEGNLANGGERIALSLQDYGTLLSFDYADTRAWPPAADGAGHSLVPLPGANQANRELDYGRNWRASTYRDGSPGLADPAPIGSVVLNELAAHTDNPDTITYPEYDSDDWIELFNITATNVNLADWYLSDDKDELSKWAIPATNQILAGDWISFNETTGFHSPITNGFGLTKDGESVFLSYLPGNAQDRVVDAIRFKGQENDVAWGRFPDGDLWLTTLTRTRDGANALAFTQKVVMAEVHYHPAPNELHPADNDEDEFIALYNPNPFDITLESEGGSWRVDGGVDYTFPSGAVISAMSELLLVSFDPNDVMLRDDFFFIYGLTNGQVNLHGPWSGKLDNHVGSVALERPQLPDQPFGETSWVIVDEVLYFDRNPWPVEADGDIASLHRVNDNRPGDEPANWVAATPSPGSRIVGFVPTVNTTNGPGSVAQFAADLDGMLVSTGSAPAFLSVHWGTNDGGRIAGNWETARTLGLTAPGPLSETVTGLLENTVYVYRYLASNALGDSWSFPAASFKTLGAPGITSTGMIPGVAEAAIQGHLFNGTMAAVTIFWGLNDGGTNPSTWPNRLDLGTLPEGPFQTTITGLISGVCYAYRPYASNLAGEAWATSSFFAHTLTPVGPPFYVTNVVYSNITAFTAQTGARLHAPQRAFDMEVYYGLTDAGTDAGAWDHGMYVGSFTNASNLVVNAHLEELTAGAAHFFTFRAVNCLGEETWASPANIFTNQPGYDMSIRKTASITNLTDPAAVFSYTIEVINAGPAQIPTVDVTDVLPPGLTILFSTHVPISSQGRTNTYRLFAQGPTLYEPFNLFVRYSAPLALTLTNLVTIPYDWNPTNNTDEALVFIPDADGDRSPDYFDEDDDGDGASDADELIANTDPLDGSSFLWVRVEGTGGQTVRRLTFPTSTGRTYRVEASPTLSSNAWNTIYANLPGLGTNRVMMHTNALDRMYYRIGVERP